MYYQNCFDKCVFIDDKVVGFVSPTGNIYVNAKKSATLSMDGFIDTSDGTSGYIEDKKELKRLKKLKEKQKRKEEKLARKNKINQK